MGADDKLLRELAGEQEPALDENVEINNDLTRGLLQQKIDRANEEIKDLQQDRTQRKIFSYCIFGFMCLYMAASLVIVFFCGFGKMVLDVSVLITLLTTTLANVIGVFTFVAKYLFHNK